MADNPREYVISIHAPVKGATPEEDHGRGHRHISIHAPVKGATPTTPPRSRKATYFNPRSREGSDWSDPMSHIGEVLISIHAPVKGATKLFGFELGGHGISIHAPVKGATPSTVIQTVRVLISIHAPVKGATS